MKEKKECALFVQGGLGKELCATTLVKYLKKKGYDKIITISGYPEIFFSNPDIYRNLHLNTSYLEDDYLRGIEIFSGEPYQLLDYRNGKKHLNNLYPLAYRFPEENYDTFPKIHTTEQEEMEAQQIIQNAPNSIITVQFQGGPIISSPNGQPISQNNTRNLNQHQAQLIVDRLIENGFSVLQLKAGNQFACKNAQILNLPPRAYMVLSKFTAGHVGIDSFMNHVAAAWKKPALVFWNSTNYRNLGYPTAVNVYRDKCPIPMCNRPRVGYADVVPGGIWQCPHDKICQRWTDEEIIKHTEEFCKKLKGDNNVEHKEHSKTDEEGQRKREDINSGHDVVPDRTN